MAVAQVAELPHAEVIGLAADQPEWRILIVDDNADSRRLLRQGLEPMGFASGSITFHVDWDKVNALLAASAKGPAPALPSPRVARPTWLDLLREAEVVPYE